jgi:hypothetical protein
LNNELLKKIELRKVRQVAYISRVRRNAYDFWMLKDFLFCRDRASNSKSKDQGQGRTQPANSPSLSCEWLERGRKAGMIRRSPVYGRSIVPCPKQGKGTKECPAQLFFPFPTPRMGGEE